MRRWTSRIAILIVFGFLLSSCFITGPRRHRHKRHCPRGKVMVKHHGKYKCQRAHKRHGHKKHKRKHKKHKRKHRR